MTHGKQPFRYLAYDCKRFRKYVVKRGALAEALLHAAELGDDVLLELGQPFLQSGDLLLQLGNLGIGGLGRVFFETPEFFSELEYFALLGSIAGAVSGAVFPKASQFVFFLLHSWASVAAAFSLA